jgi:hypothetical protein
MRATREKHVESTHPPSKSRLVFLHVPFFRSITQSPRPLQDPSTTMWLAPALYIHTTPYCTIGHSTPHTLHARSFNSPGRPGQTANPPHRGWRRAAHVTPGPVATQEHRGSHWNVVRVRHDGDPPLVCLVC